MGPRFGAPEEKLRPGKQEGNLAPVPEQGSRAKTQVPFTCSQAPRDSWAYPSSQKMSHLQGAPRIASPVPLRIFPAPYWGQETQLPFPLSGHQRQLGALPLNSGSHLTCLPLRVLCLEPSPYGFYPQGPGEMQRWGSGMPGWRVKDSARGQGGCRCPPQLWPVHA